MGVYQKTLAELKTQIATELDDSSNLTWTATVLGELINREYIDLLELAQRYGDFLNSSVDVSVKGNTQEYDLPADFGMARKVIRLDDDMELWQGSYDDYFQPGTDIQTGYSEGYYIRNAYSTLGATTEYAKIGLIPTSDIGFTCRVIYQALPQEMSATTDRPRIPGIHHELIILGAVIRAYRMKGKLDMVSAYWPEYARKYRLFEKWLSDNRQRFKGDRFINIYGRVR